MIDKKQMDDNLNALETMFGKCEHLVGSFYYNEKRNVYDISNGRLIANSLITSSLNKYRGTDLISFSVCINKGIKTYIFNKQGKDIVRVDGKVYRKDKFKTDKPNELVIALCVNGSIIKAAFIYDIVKSELVEVLRGNYVFNSSKTKLLYTHFNKDGKMVVDKYDKV